MREGLKIESLDYKYFDNLKIFSLSMKILSTMPRSVADGKKKNSVRWANAQYAAFEII
jgi:hypothetical protein